jgi:plasmid maintenance system antidote protein VapI
MSTAELARRLDVPTNRVTEILKGRRTVTGDSALRFARFFGKQLREAKERLRSAYVHIYKESGNSQALNPDVP